MFNRFAPFSPSSSLSLPAFYFLPLLLMPSFLPLLFVDFTLIFSHFYHKATSKCFSLFSLLPSFTYRFTGDFTGVKTLVKISLRFELNELKSSIARVNNYSFFMHKYASFPDQTCKNFPINSKQEPAAACLSSWSGLCSSYFTQCLFYAITFPFCFLFTPSSHIFPRNWWGRSAMAPYSTPSKKFSCSKGRSRFS